jgi:serine O-acetyltransferase
MPRHPRFLEAVAADTRFVAPRWGRPLGERPGRRRILAETLRLAWESDAYFAQIVYRLRADLLRRGIPVLPRILHRISIVWIHMSISETVLIRPGISIPHGLVTIGGVVEIGPGVLISPSVSIGLTASGGYEGPKIGAGAHIGTGTRILGPVKIGRRARIGANSVVLDDIPDGATAVGAPARVVSGGAEAEARSLAAAEVPPLDEGPAR